MLEKKTIKLIYHHVPRFQFHCNHNKKKRCVRTMLNPSQLVTSLTVTSNLSIIAFGPGPETLALIAARLDFHLEGLLVKLL